MLILNFIFPDHHQHENNNGTIEKRNGNTRPNSSLSESKFHLTYNE